MNIFNDLLYIFLGFFVNHLNYLGIRLTAKKFLKEKQQSIVALSLPIRLFIFALVFYVLVHGSFRKAILFVLGVTLSTILFVINRVINRGKNENINR